MRIKPVCRYQYWQYHLYVTAVRYGIIGVIAVPMSIQPQMGIQNRAVFAHPGMTVSFYLVGGLLSRFTPDSDNQICIAHQIRNAMRYVAWKDRKEFSRDMKAIYHAPTIQAAAKALEDLAIKWNDRYPHSIQSQRNKWQQLTAFFEYPPSIRKSSIPPMLQRASIVWSEDRYRKRQYSQLMTLFSKVFIWH